MDKICKKYNGFSLCPKCGGIAHSLNYQYSPIEEVGEYLIITCNQCGYTHTELCMDAAD